jgi:starch synthase
MTDSGTGSEIKALFVSAEIVPFAKEGGLADVAGALPKALKEQGVDVRAVLPLYGGIQQDKFGVRKLPDIQPFSIEMGEASQEAEIYTTHLPDSEVIVYMISNDNYFWRKGVYNDPDTGEGYPDNAKRYIFFQKAVLELLRRLDWRPDLVHCNDHHTSLIPFYLRRDPGDTLHGIASLFSIHNLAYQGNEPPAILPIAEIPAEQFYPVSPFEFYGHVNLMKIGIVFADKISTVSPTYAKEIQSGSEYGFGLEGVLRSRASDLKGIVNGIDYAVWNPETDTLIPHNYSAADLEGKWKNKEELLRANRLPPPEGRVALIGMISRLAEQKGFDILGEALDRIMKLDLQLVILGTGKREYHESLEAAAARYPAKLAVNLAFDNKLAHLIEAGADMFLMPSRYEPCGLNQLYSLRYGTIPIVRATGGLADTIKPYDPATQRGTGFSFREYTSDALFGAVRQAVELFKDEQAWNRLSADAMAEDFSWRASAGRYLALYLRALEKARRQL